MNFGHLSKDLFSTPAQPDAIHWSPQNSLTGSQWQGSDRERNRVTGLADRQGFSNLSAPEQYRRIIDSVWSDLPNLEGNAPYNRNSSQPIKTRS